MLALRGKAAESLHVVLLFLPTFIGERTADQSPYKTYMDFAANQHKGDVCKRTSADEQGVRRYHGGKAWMRMEEKPTMQN